MLYFKHHFTPIAHRLERVDVCRLEATREGDMAHAADEIRAALSGIPVHLVDAAELRIEGAGQLLVWPVGAAGCRGPLPVPVRAVVARGGYAALIDARRRDLVLVEPHGQLRWLWREWRIRAWTAVIALATRIGAGRRLSFEP